MSKTGTPSFSFKVSGLDEAMPLAFGSAGTRFFFGLQISSTSLKDPPRRQYLIINRQLNFTKPSFESLTGKKMNACNIFAERGEGKWFDNIYPALVCLGKTDFFSTFWQWSRAKVCLHLADRGVLSHDSGSLYAAACREVRRAGEDLSSSIYCNLRARGARSRSQNSRAKESGDQTAFVHRGGLTMPHRMLFALSVLLVSVYTHCFLFVDAHTCRLFASFSRQNISPCNLCSVVFIE